jgi:hypothetical protein
VYARKEKGIVKKYMAGATTHPITHLVQKHKISEDAQSETSSIISTGPENIINQPFINAMRQIQFNAAGCKQLLLFWIITGQVSFRQIENEWFCLLLHYLSVTAVNYNAIPPYLPRSHTTIPTLIHQIYQSRKASMVTALHNSIADINISFDMWSSNNSLALVGIVGDWVCSKGEVVDCHLALREVHGSHSGENQASILTEMFKECGLEKRVGYFTLDNATNNDTAAAATEHQL